MKFQVIQEPWEPSDHPFLFLSWVRTLETAYEKKIEKLFHKTPWHFKIVSLVSAVTFNALLQEETALFDVVSQSIYCRTFHYWPLKTILFHCYSFPYSQLALKLTLKVKMTLIADWLIIKEQMDKITFKASLLCDQQWSCFHGIGCVIEKASNKAKWVVTWTRAVEN